MFTSLWKEQKQICWAEVNPPLVNEARPAGDPHWPRWAAVEFWKIDCDYYKNGLQLRMHLMVMAEDKWSTTASDARSWIGGNRAGSRAKERKMSYGARHQRSRARRRRVSYRCVFYTHTHWLPLPSSPARPKLCARGRWSRTHATHSDTVFSVSKFQVQKLLKSWSTY